MLPNGKQKNQGTNNGRAQQARQQQKHIPNGKLIAHLQLRTLSRRRRTWKGVRGRKEAANLKRRNLRSKWHTYIITPWARVGAPIAAQL